MHIMMPVKRHPAVRRAGAARARDRLRRRSAARKCTLRLMYVIVWKFVARRGREAEFEAAYGPRGRWSEFFRTGDGYLGTELWRGESGSWVTVDRWRSEE